MKLCCLIMMLVFSANLFGLLLLACHFLLAAKAFTPCLPSLAVRQSELWHRVILRDTSENIQDDQKRKGGILRGIRNISGRVEKLAKKGGSDVTSAVGATSARLSELAERGGSDVLSIASSAVTGLKGVAERGASDVASVANTTTYNAGEVVRWIDVQAKDGASVANNATKSLVLGFTGKPEYQVGDISKELLRRAATADLNDIMLLLKISLAVGASIGPLAKALPISVLLEMLNVSLERQIGGKFLEVLAATLDDRFSAAFNNDDKFQLGDAVKRSATSAILKFTGKSSYKAGDIERAVVAEENKREITRGTPGECDAPAINTLDLRVSPEFECWDEKFREAHPEGLASFADTGTNPKALDMKIAMELENEGLFQTSINSKFCIFCGTKLPSVAKYCSSCGEEQP